MAAGDPEAEQINLDDDAFIVFADEDRGWAELLRSELLALGVSVADLELTLFDYNDAVAARLGQRLRLPTMIVLWTPPAHDKSRLGREIASFAALPEHYTGGSARILPIFFGPDLASSAPEPLRSIVGVILDPMVYAAGVGDDGPLAARVSWAQSVEKIAAALLAERRSAVDPSPPSKTATELRPDIQEELGAMRIRLPETEQLGWKLGGDLAIVRNVTPLPSQVPVITTDVRLLSASVASLPADPPFDQLSNFSLLRLKDEPRPLASPPLSALSDSLPVEVWGFELSRSNGRGRIGDANPDGSVDLELSERGAIEQGSAVWSPVSSHLLGIAAFAGEGEWRLLPVELFHEIAKRILPSTAPPSARIHTDGWTTEDCLDYTLYATAISEFIRHRDTKAPLVIGIQGPWGQGKTSLMRLAQQRLDPGHPDLAKRQQPKADPEDGSSELTFGELRESLDGDVDLEDPQPAGARTVWFNPWKYQSSEALWAGLAHAILGQLPARLSRRQQELFWLQLQARRIDVGAVRRDIHRLLIDRLLPWLGASLLLGIVVAVVCVAVGLTAAITALGGLAATLGGAAISWVFARREALNRKLEGNYLRYVSQPDYSGKLGYFHYVEEDMRRALDLLTPTDEPTVIFIDDLDRCSASRIGEVLEAVNLFLSGEYPNCYFVLGIDAQVVASAMATAHRAALGESQEASENGSATLGWRFLDKFIQLSFVMPRISDAQRAVYLKSLLGVEPDPEDPAAEEPPAEAEEILRQVTTRDLDPARASSELGELRAEAPAARSRALRRVAEDVIVRGARDFRDTDPKMVAALADRLPYLSDNPRTIKRAVNLYRFYQFISWARGASAPELANADTELLARWTVIAARWPQAIHWLQVHGQNGDDPMAKLLEAHQDEPDLKEFLSQEPRINLEHAMQCGLW